MDWFNGRIFPWIFPWILSHEIPWSAFGTRLDLVFEAAEHPTDEVLQRHLAAIQPVNS